MCFVLEMGMWRWESSIWSTRFCFLTFGSCLRRIEKFSFPCEIEVEGSDTRYGLGYIECEKMRGKLKVERRLEGMLIVSGVAKRTGKNHEGIASEF